MRGIHHILSECHRIFCRAASVASVACASPMITAVGTVLWVSACLTSCTAAFQEPDPRDRVYVRFELSVPGETGSKSSLSVDETRVDNINLYAYSAGRLHDAFYSDDLSAGIGMELSGNADYNIYALVNTGRTDAPDMEEDLSSLVYRPGSQGSLGENGLPMSAMAQVSPASVVEPVSLNLVRLVSKVKFVMDRGELGGLEVRSVRLMQSPCDVRPFSKESMASEVSDGDYATDEDIAGINAGQPVFFYMLENCQGVLLPDNNDQWQKVPDNIPDRAGLCTYIEVMAEFDGSTGLSGPVTYRFFLGQDNTSDFNVFRNTESTVTLSLTEDGLDRVSWRVDNSGLTMGDLKYILDAPEYAGQWGKVTFPEATEEHPVTITHYGETLQIPSETAAHFGDVEEDSPDLLVYLPSEPNTVYLCSGSSRYSFDASQGIRQGTVSFTQNTSLKWALEIYTEDGFEMLYGGETITVNESGEDNSCYMYLADNGRIIDPGIFSMPENVREYIDRVRTCDDIRTHLYWYYQPDMWVEDNAMADQYIDWSYKPALDTNGESYLYEVKLYGLQADGLQSGYTELACYQNFCGVRNDFRIKIDPAFRGQRHFGAVYNYQMALGDMQRSRTVLDTGYELPRDAAWRIGRGDKYVEGCQEEPLNSVLDVYDESLVSVSRSGSGIVLDFEEPSGLQDVEYLAGGRYHVRGTVTNPYSGRVINGDYSVDIILYIVVGMEAHFYPAEEGYDLDPGTYLDIAYVPIMGRYGQDDDYLYHTFWEENGYCSIYSPKSGSISGMGSPFFYERKVETFDIRDFDNLDRQFTLISDQMRNYLYECGTDFQFIHNDTQERSATLLYYDPAWNMSNRLFFELHRLQDIERNTFLIEDYYGSYDNY